jgi:hypothetical protein
MDLKKQVVSLEYAKRLKELGVYADTYFHWAFNPFAHGQEWFLDDENLAYDPDYSISAFTVAELGELLPIEIFGVEGMRYDLNIWKSKEGWNAAYWWDEDSRRRVKTMSITFNEKNLVDAMARTLISLIEQDLYDPQNAQKIQTTV